MQLCNSDLLRIILEGPNYCGKDAIVAALLSRCKNAVIIDAHGYWRPTMGQQTGLNPTQLREYFKNRTCAYLPLIKAVCYEELIIDRLHLTDIVYSQLYLDEEQDYTSLEEELNQLRVGLVLLDVDDETLQARSAINPRGTSGHADRSLPALISKRDLFRQAFQYSVLERKLWLDNSNGQPPVEEQAERIINWWQSLVGGDNV